MPFVLSHFCRRGAMLRISAEPVSTLAGKCSDSNVGLISCVNLFVETACVATRGSKFDASVQVTPSGDRADYGRSASDS